MLIPVAVFKVSVCDVAVGGWETLLRSMENDDLIGMWMSCDVQPLSVSVPTVTFRGMLLLTNSPNGVFPSMLNSLWSLCANKPHPDCPHLARAICH